MATINEALNLVLPIKSDDTGVRLYAFHSPISREVFEANYELLGAVKAKLMSKGPAYNISSGPVIAALTLRDEGRKDAAENGEQGDGGAAALLNELKRLTVVLVPTANGWETIPVDASIAQGHLDAEDWSETESAIVFFTCLCAMAKRADKAKFAAGAASILKGSTTSSTATAFSDSLPTSTTTAPSVTKAASSVPS
jgi:hypothetical protein